MPIVASTEVLAVTSSWLEAFVLLAAAHTAAWASGYLLRNRLAAPIDGGLKMMDGRRLLGDHKTWRGLIAAVLTCALAIREAAVSLRALAAPPRSTRKRLPRGLPGRRSSSLRGCSE